MSLPFSFFWFFGLNLSSWVVKPLSSLLLILLLRKLPDQHPRPMTELKHWKEHSKQGTTGRSDRIILWEFPMNFVYPKVSTNMKINLPFPLEIWPPVKIVAPRYPASLYLQGFRKGIMAVYGLCLIPGMAVFHTLAPVVSFAFQGFPPPAQAQTCPGSTSNDVFLTCDRNRISHLTLHLRSSPNHCNSLVTASICTKWGFITIFAIKIP